METEIQNASPSPMKRAYRKIVEHYEQAAYFLLLLWCLLPAVMCVKFVIAASTGKFTSPEKLAEQGLELGDVTHNYALASYQRLFLILGGVTLCFVLFLMALSWRRVFSLKSLREKPWFYLFALFLVWALVCATRSEYYYYAFYGDGYLLDGLKSYCVYGGVFLCASVLRREDYRRKIMLAFIAVIAMLALIMLVQENTDIFFLNYCFASARAVVFNQFNHFGYMLCLAAAVCAGFFLYESGDKRRKLLYLAGFAYLVYALVVNDTFGALLAVILAIPVMLILYARSGRKLNWRALGLALLIILAALIILGAVTGGRGPLGNFVQLKEDLVKILTGAEDAGDAGTERFGLWQETLERISARPIFGYGPEGLLIKYALSGGRTPHNTYLQIAAYTGIPGFLFYFFAILLLAVHHCKRLKTLDTMVLIASGGAFAYMASAFVGVPVFNTEPYFWLFLGLATLTSKTDQPLIYLETPEK